MNPMEINAQLIIPEAHESSSIQEEEAAFIYHFLREKGLTRTLEIGLAFGRSAAHILAATSAEHIAVDPFQAHFDNLGLTNIQKIGMEDRFSLLEEPSHDALPKLKREGRQFEFVFIDGDHKFDGIFIDFYFSDLLLARDGYLLFHDTWMRSTQLVCSFIRKNRENYEEIVTPLANLRLFKKKSEQDTRDWKHFREFYTFKAILKHMAIGWLSERKAK